MLEVCIFILVSRCVLGYYYTHTSGYMTSPSYPYHAGDGTSSTNTINTGATLISLTFHVINTEANYDFVRVYDRNGYSLYSASGVQNPYLLKSDTYFRVVYTTDNSVASVGYYASWRVAPSTLLRQVPPLTFSCGTLRFEEVSSSGLAFSCNEIFSSPSYKDCFNVCASDSACKAFQLSGGVCTSFGSPGYCSVSRQSTLWVKK